MPLNIEKLYARFQDINESIARLRQLGSLPIVDFAADQDKLDVASFRLIVATEAAIDICFHASAKLLKKVPDDYACCFKLLADQALIDKDLATRLARMARFRNLLVHHYWKIDYMRLHQIIGGPDLDDLSEFIRQINGLVNQKDPPTE
jgi:uncharacterized protein YutE (UPF0331/DUF86 family)